MATTITQGDRRRIRRLLRAGHSQRHIWRLYRKRHRHVITAIAREMGAVTLDNQPTLSDEQVASRLARLAAAKEAAEAADTGSP